MAAIMVVDNSVVMAWCFADADGEYADRILDKLVSAEALVPAIWPLEVGNVLLTAERRKRLTPADSIRFLALLGNLPIIVEQETPDRMMREIFSLAREYNLSTYDASYLDLAMRKGLPLATLDDVLIRAAAKSKVEVL